MTSPYLVALAYQIQILREAHPDLTEEELEHMAELIIADVTIAEEDADDAQDDG